MPELQTDYGYTWDYPFQGATKYYQPGLITGDCTCLTNPMGSHEENDQ